MIVPYRICTPNMNSLKNATQSWLFHYDYQQDKRHSDIKY